MPLPYTLVNGETPDAEKIMANFNHVLTITAAPQSATLSALVAAAAARPTTPFFGWATDAKQLYFYTGDVTFQSDDSPAGFKVIA